MIPKGGGHSMMKSMGLIPFWMSSMTSFGYCSVRPFGWNPSFNKRWQRPTGTGQYSVAHYRAEYGREVDRHPKLREPSFIQTIAFNAVKCAIQLRPGDPIYFASDNMIALDAIRRIAAYTKYPILTFDREETISGYWYVQCHNPWSNDSSTVTRNIYAANTNSNNIYENSSSNISTTNFWLRRGNHST